MGNLAYDRLGLCLVGLGRNDTTWSNLISWSLNQSQAQGAVEGSKFHVILVRFKIVFESSLFTKFETDMEYSPSLASVPHTLPLWNSDFVCMRVSLQVNKINVLFDRSTERNLQKGKMMMKVDSSQSCPPFSPLNYPKLKCVTKTVTSWG